MIAVIPRFEPHPLLPNGHWQTIGGTYLPSSASRPPFRMQEIALTDGDRVAILDSVPEGWRRGAPGAVLIHGLCGSADSPYIVRVASRLLELGVRVVRMNLRGAGAGYGLARRTYHAGRSGDVRSVLEWFSGESPGSPVALVGFSLGANLALKLAAEAASDPLPNLDCVLAANPPLDLSACCRNLRRPERRAYDRNFVRALRRDVTRLHARFTDLGPPGLEDVRTVYDFDDRYTAPRNGFRDAEDYYARSSAGPLLPKIRVDGLVIHAQDDPFIPIDTFRGWEFPASLALELIPSGGHLGYISRFRWDGSRRWLDARLAFWLAERWRPHLRTRRGGPYAHDHRQSE